MSWKIVSGKKSSQTPSQNPQGNLVPGMVGYQQQQDVKAKAIAQASLHKAEVNASEALPVCIGSANRQSKVDQAQTGKAGQGRGKTNSAFVQGQDYRITNAGKGGKGK